MPFPNGANIACKIPGCQARISPTKLVCPSHWHAASVQTRQNLLQAYTRGHGWHHAPSPAWNRAAAALLQEIVDTLGLRGPETDKVIQRYSALADLHEPRKP